jgi:hypothetical protein
MPDRQSPVPVGSPVPRLRRPVATDEARRSGRRLIVAGALFLVALIVAVVVPLVLIGLHNNGAKIPSRPAGTSSPAAPGSN